MPNETPKLDTLKAWLEMWNQPYSESPTPEQRLTLIEDALMEIRSLIKVARIGATNVSSKGAGKD